MIMDHEVTRTIKDGLEQSLSGSICKKLNTPKKRHLLRKLLGGEMNLLLELLSAHRFRRYISLADCGYGLFFEKHKAA